MLLFPIEELLKEEQAVLSEMACAQFYILPLYSQCSL